jgi:hypothetical protein
MDQFFPEFWAAVGAHTYILENGSILPRVLYDMCTLEDA